MLVTKREVKQASKKLLSVLLAFIMMMTSMSVCFGSIVASAEDVDHMQVLADKLKDSSYSQTLSLLAAGKDSGSGVARKVNITFSSYINYKQAAELLRLVDNAMKASECWAHLTKYNDDQQSACEGRTTQDIYNELIKTLAKKGTNTDDGTDVQKFLRLVLTWDGAVLHSGAVKSKSQSTWTNTITFSTSDYKGYLAQVGKAANVASSVETGVKYTLTMPGNLYYGVAGSCGSTIKYYHNMFWPKSSAVNAPATNGSNTEAYTKVQNHITELNSFINLTFEQLLDKAEAGTLDSTIADYNSKKAAAVTYVGSDATYASLFADYQNGINNFLTSAQSAKDFQAYLPTVDNWNDFVTANPDYGVFQYPNFGAKGSATQVKLLEDYATFKAYYDYLVSGGDIYTYLVDNNYIDETYYTNFYDNVVAYDLQDSKDKADALYLKYSVSNPSIDGEELAPGLEEKNLVYSELCGYINAIGAYSPQVVNAVYYDGYAYLIDLREMLKCDINAAVLYFAEEADKTFTTLSTAALWAKIDEAKAQNAALTALYNDVKANVGEARANELLSAIRASATNMIENLYKTLADRFTAEVNNAWDLYVEMGKPTALKVESFLKLSAVMVSIEPDILTDLQGAGKAGYITQTTIDRYNELMKVGGIYEIWNAYATTFGFPDYKQTQLTYADRTPMEGDELKTSADSVTEAEMLKLIEALDKIITSDLVGDLLSGLLGAEAGEEFNLGAMLTDLIKGALFTDDFINTVVQMLYPLVLGEFNKVWATLPTSIEYSGMDVTVRYKKSLNNILDEGNFEIYPDLLAQKLIDLGYSTKYAENIANLTAAGGEADSWESPKLVDYETGKLKLSWGVTEQKEKLDAGEITQAQFDKFFYDAFEHATAGLLPLLTTLITNVAWTPSKCENIATGQAAIVTLNVALQLGSEANRGYANMLVPIYELLGVPYTAVSSIEGSTDVSYVLEQILKPIFTFLGELGEAPVDTILGILPNLIYALAFRMAKPMLNMLKTKITYIANAGIAGDVLSDGADVAIGDMLITDEEDALLPESMFVGGLNSILAHFGLNIPAIDQATLATLGKLDKTDTSRAAYIYSGLEDTGKAYTIKADKADVGYYLLSYILNIVKDEASLKQLLGLFMTQKDENGEVIKDSDGKAIPDTEAMDKLINETLYNDEGLNLDEINVGNAIAAIVELANQVEYNVGEYYWYDGSKSTPIGTTSATEIYLNPNNDWTEDKAEYLYNNLEALLTSILTMAKLDLDKSTEEVDGSIEGALEEAIGGLFTNETVTALAKLLGSLSDLGALLAPKEEEAPEASEPETVADGEEAEEEAPLIDINKLIKDELGIDLSVYAQYKDLAEDEEIDFGVTDADSFVKALTDLLAPLKPLLDFILAGKDLTLIDSAITLQGYKGYDNAIIPLLEALGAAPAAYTDGADTLALTLNALVGVINKLTTNDPAVEKDGAIYTIIDMLPGVIYYISSNALSQGIDKLLTPVYAILDTIRPIYNVNLNELLAGIEIGEEGAKKPLGLDIKNITWSFIFELLNDLLGLDLSALQQVIYDVCDDLGVTYTSKSTLQSTWKKGAYNANFSQADMLTVVLSFVLEWITVPANGEKLDEMLGTDGIVASIGSVFESVEITYGTPNWMYWFESEEAFNEYLANPSRINTLASIDWENIGDNDWDLETAQYFAENIDELVDLIIGMINEGKTDDEGNALPTTLSALLSDLVNGLVNAETLNDLVGMITGLLGDIDDNLLEAAGYLLGVDIVGLKAYECEADIDSISDFINELANVLDTYAGGLINWLFFGDDYRFAKKSDSTDTIVINGGYGYEKGLALILEALGCELPAEANTKSVLGALATRVEAILADPINEVLDLLPNLVYFLNANGAGVAVDNLLQPVYALLAKLSAFGLEVNLADLLKITKEDGTEIAIDLAKLSLANVVEIVEGATDLPLDAAADILVNFCTGKITKGTYIYKMEAAREDIITILLVVALELISDDAFAAKLDEMLGSKGIVEAIKGIFEGSEITYATPNWNYMDGVVTEEGITEYVNAIVSYPNDWTEEKAQYLADNLPALVDTVIKMLEINGVKYESLSALLKANVNVFTTETLNSLIDLIKNLLGGIDAGLLEVGFILDVKLVDTKDKDGKVVPGLMSYTAPEGIDTVEDFALELANVLNTYAKGAVEWLLLGRDFKLIVKDADGTGEGLVQDGSYITVNGAQGYAEGLALLLEALGCKNLPEVYGVENLDTAATVTAVLKSLAARINEILEMPVERVLEILPNLIYFLDANGVAVVIENTLAALNGIVDKLEVFGIELDITSLVDLPKLMGIEDKYAEGEEKIGLDNLTLVALLRALSLMTGLDFTELQNVLVPFALGEAVKYDSVSASDAYKMVYKTDLDKHDMLSVIVSAALRMFFAGTETSDKNAAKLDEMLGTDIISALKDVFEGVVITYAAPNWNYMNGVVTDDAITDYVNAIVAYPNDWTEAKAEYLAENLPALVDTVIKMIEIDGVKYDSLAVLLNNLLSDAEVFSTKNLQALVDLIAGLLKDIDDGLLDAAGVLLGADVVGLKDYKAPEGITTVDAFASELANVLNTYAKGVVEWLLLGEDYKFFVKEVKDGVPVDFIVINGAEGYAEGLALLLEALGCENLPAADGKTEDIVSGVLSSLAALIDKILANPVEEVINLLPNVIYFLNTNGVAAVVDNTIAALTALLTKLEAFGLELNINELVNLKKIMKLEDTDAKISLDNLTLEALFEALGLMLGLDLSELTNVLVPFAIGEAYEYDSVSASKAYKMGYKNEYDKHDMLSVIVTAALKVVVENEDNAAKLDEMLGTDIVSALKDVFASVEILYTAPDWNYPLADNGTVDAMKYSITYPNNWTEATAEAVTEFLLSDDFDALITGLIDKNYATLSDLLKAKVNVFTTDNLQAIVDLIADLLKDIDDGLLEAAGVLLGADVEGLKAYKAPAGITTVDAFAAELANVLNTYAKGVVEWLLLGNDYTFFVKEVDENGLPVDFITINGAHGYAEGLALLLEALGCKNLPEVYGATATTEEIVTGVLGSLAARINEIFADPVNEIVDLLPNLLYFLNTNGVSAVVDNTLAALTVLLEKLEAFGLKLDLNELVNLKKLMKIEDTDATISLDNLSMADLLQAVSYMIEDLDITYIKDILVGFALGKVEAYTSVSKEVGETKKMVYATEFDKHDMVTVVANILLITIAYEDNEAFVKNLVGEKIYTLILDLLNLSTNEVPVKYMDWQGVPDKVGQIFNALETSPNYKGFEYGPLYTEEMAQYIADNIGRFIDNIIYLLGLEINGENVDSLEELLDSLVGGSLYNSDLVITIRDALAGLVGSIEGLEVEGKNVGKLIVKVLAAAEIADLEAIGKVAVPEFREDDPDTTDVNEAREDFVASLCNVLEPAYGLLTWLLADESLEFFVDLEKNDFITLPGAEGYRNGIALLLEAIGCEGLPAELNGEGDAVVKAILNPLLNRLDEIFANPAEEILAVLTNVIYFINSNGVDVVIKNTLNAVYTVLAAIEPVAKVDLYELVGLDAYVTLSAEELIDMLLSKLEVAGFDFTALSVDFFSELTIGKLEAYDSISDQLAAYRMVYDAEYANEADMITAVMRLVITFILTENNREVLINLLKTELGMSADAEKYVRALLNSFGDCIVGKNGEDLRLGMDTVLATIYYVFYSLDISADEMATGKKDLNEKWKKKLEELNKDAASEETKVGDLITDILDILFNDTDKVPEDGGNDVLDQDGLASNGFLAFFARIKAFFQEIADFFRNLFSFGK